MSQTEDSLDTLVSISGTLASIGLALVGILAAKSSIDHVETIADDLFLFSSLGFLFVLALAYIAQKDASAQRRDRMLRTTEWIFSGSLVAIVLGAFVLVYSAV